MHGKYLATLLFLAISFTNLHAQEAATARPSPVAIVSCKYKDTYLKIVYGQPQKKGREIFGKLVPYGQVWRLGANEATEIVLTRDVFVNGQLLPAGTYSMFAIPEKDKWTLIFNKELGQWGSYNYNVAKDALRIDLPVQAVAAHANVESFTIAIDQKNNKAEISMSWDATTARFNVDFIEPKP